MGRIFGLWLMLMLLAACPKKTELPIIHPGEGNMWLWSKQIADSRKKIVFIPGCINTNDPNGLDQVGLEYYFDIKVKNLDSIGVGKFGVQTSALAEYWFFGYYAGQKLSNVADDLYAAINENSRFRGNCAVAVVAHSQGATICWILDQRHPDCLAGGALLGGPHLSTPAAHKDVRDRAVIKTFPLLHDKLIPLFDQLAIGTEQLMASYQESGMPNSQLKFYAGRISSPSSGFWERNTNLLDALLAAEGFMGRNGASDNRQFAELGATIITQSEWGTGSEWDKQSDGLVPVSSAVLNGQVPNYQVLDGYDHWDLLSGKGDLTLDREILDWLDYVLKLKPGWVETDLPNTPDIIELPNEVNDALVWARFVYVDAAGKLTLTDSDWEKTYTLPIAGVHSSPQFNDEGTSLAFDVNNDDCSNIYLLSGAAAKQISFDGQSRYPAWSPDGKWLAYQDSTDLLIHRLADNQRYTVAKVAALTSSPVWTVSGINGRLYFVNQNRELRWVSPRERKTNSTNLVQANCSQPFLVKSPLKGMIVIGPGTAADSQRVTVVTGVLADHLSVEVRYDPAKWNIKQNDANILLTLDHQFNFTEAAYDPTYNHLYLVGEWDKVWGIYLLDIQAFLDCSKPDPNLTDFFLLIREGASQLAIRPPS